MRAFRPFLWTWVAALLLLGASVGLAYAPLGRFSSIVPLPIAAVQAFLIMAVFMKLRGRPSWKWVFAGAGFYWLCILIGLSCLDYATRSGFTKP